MNPSGARLVLVVALVLTVAGSGVAHAGPSGGAVPARVVEEITVAGRHGIPLDAEMIAANITAVGPYEPGFVTVWPCDEDRPTTSNINYITDDVAPNLVLSRISDAGTICVYTLKASDVIVDIAGYVPAGSDITPLASPVRFVDTRDGGPEPLPAGRTIDVPVAGLNGVGPDADIVMFNATAIGFDQPGHLTVHPCGEPLPATSSVNFEPGQVVANMVTSRVGLNGSVCIYTLAPAEIIVDVTAYATSGIEPLLNPVRVVDTRVNDAPVDAGGVLIVDMAVVPGVSDTATAAIYNLTSVGSTDAGFAISYPCDVSRPTVSNLNHRAGQTVANGTITKLSSKGEICIYTLAQAHLIVDLIGYTEGTTDYVPLDPVRILDTREGWQPLCDWVIVDFGTQHVTVANIETSEIRQLPFAQASDTEVEPIVGGACDGVYRYADDAVPSRVQFVGLDRSQSFSEVSDDVESLGIRRIHSVGGRLLGSNELAVVVDIETDEEIWAGPPGRRVVRDLDVAPTGRAIVEFQLNTSELWDMASNTQLPSAWGDMYSPFAFSPDGRYIVIIDSQIIVITADGQYVDSITMPRRFSFGGTGYDFVGNGSLVICQPGHGLFRFDLFSLPPDLFYFDVDADTYDWDPSWEALTAAGATDRTCIVN